MVCKQDLAFFEMTENARVENELRNYIKTLPTETQQALKELNVLYPK